MCFFLDGTRKQVNDFLVAYSLGYFYAARHIALLQALISDESKTVQNRDDTFLLTVNIQFSNWIFQTHIQCSSSAVKLKDMNKNKQNLYLIN